MSRQAAIFSVARYIALCDAEDRKAKAEGRAPDYAEAARQATVVAPPVNLLWPPYRRHNLES